MDAPRNDRLAALTGLRFAAALGILLFHYGAPLLAGAPAPLERIRAGGHVWVGLFYLLSGFVLAHAHPSPMGRAARRAFWIARLARLYPAYLLAFALAAPFALERWAGLGAAGAAKAIAVGLATVLLVQAWFPAAARLWNTPGWSTSVVVAFYLAFPFAAGRLARLSRRGLLAAVAGAWLLSLAFPLAWLALRPDGPVADLTWEEPFWLEALKFHPVARAGEFLAGVALGLLARRGQLRAPPSAATAAALAALGVLAWGGVPYVLLHNGALVPLFAVVLLGIARGGGIAGRVLAAPPARVLGDAAFALYALQEPLWLWARRLLAPDAAAPSAAFTLAFLAGAVAVSIAVSSLLERPARRALRAALARGPARNAQAVSPLAPGERESA
jgi:peptidoglycan/LPS O-acetylase OafA/YrhL